MTPTTSQRGEGSMREQLIEAAALAAWLEYCGVHERDAPDYDDGGYFGEQRASAIADWNEHPSGCTHIGADGFRECATAALDAILVGLETPSHDITASVVAPGQDRTEAVRVFTAMLATLKDSGK